LDICCHSFGRDQSIAVAATALSLFSPMSPARHHHRHRHGSRPNGTSGSNTGATTTGLTKWKSASDLPPINGALMDRAQELRVFELHKDGSSKFMDLTVRGIYRYTLAAITDRNGIRLSTMNLTTSVTPAPRVVSTQLPTTIHEEGEDEGSHDDEENPPPPPPSSSFPPLEETPIHHTKRIPIASARSVFSPQQQPTTAGAVTYRERLGGYLHPRDMRRLVTPFSNSNEPNLIVRRHVMLLNFDPLRAIVLRDRLLLLVPDGADSLLKQLEERVHGGSSAVADSIFGALEVSAHGGRGDDETKGKSSILESIKIPSKSLETRTLSELSEDGDTEDTAATVPESEDDSEPADGEWNEMEAHEWADLPFELQCADAVLHVVVSLLAEDTYELQKAAQSHIRRMIHGQGPSDDPLAIIRVVKDAVQLMTNRVKGFIKSMNLILDDDEGMALMNLSQLLTHPERFVQPVSQQVLDEESFEPELILEANMQIALTLRNYLDLLQGQINSAKELTDQKLDATRNRLLFANMMISVVTLCVTLASLVGSFLGMNVPNHLEEDPTAFKKIVGGSVGGSIFTCFAIMAWLWVSGTIPHASKGTSSVEL
jgi:hypothetical protein